MGFIDGGNSSTQHVQPHTRRRSCSSMATESSAAWVYLLYELPLALLKLLVRASPLPPPANRKSLLPTNNRQATMQTAPALSNSAESLSLRNIAPVTVCWGPIPFNQMLGSSVTNSFVGVCAPSSICFLS